MARQSERSNRVKITQDEVIAGLLEAAKYYGEGASHSARVSAWEKLGKHLGMFTGVEEQTFDLQAGIKAAHERYRQAQERAAAYTEACVKGGSQARSMSLAK
jgi:hypothetical protein